MPHKSNTRDQKNSDAPPQCKSELEKSHPRDEEKDSGETNFHKAKKWSKPETMTMVFTGVIAVWTVVYSIFAGLQWWEIHGGSSDTHALAVAAKVQAEQSQAQTLKMKESLDKTDKLIKANFGILSTTRKQAAAAVIQAEAASRANTITQSTLELTQRAYLSVKSPETVGGGFGLMKIPIENYGHVPCRWFKIRLNYQWMEIDFTKGGVTYLDNRTLDVREDKPIYPGPNNHHIVIMMPNPPKGLTENQTITLRAKITYDTGFGKTDTLMLCEVFKDHKWESCGGLSTHIDLGEASPIHKKKNN